MKKRVTAFVLVFAMVIALAQPALAATQNAVVDRSETVLASRDDYVLSLRCESYANGDTAFLMVEEVVSWT